MPVTFRIIPQRQLILFTYSGKVGLQETIDAVAASAEHPDHQPAMRHLCDVSKVTSVERDFPKLLKLHAKIAESLLPVEEDQVVLFYAPTREGQRMARLAQKSWQGISAVIVLISDHEAEAMEMLGLKEASIAALLDEAGLKAR